MSAAKQRLVILNLPELGAAPPEWEEVQGSFRGAEESVLVRAILLLLIGQREEARKLKESQAAMPPEQCKYWDGQANAANEMIGNVLHLLRGEGKMIDRGVRGLFGQSPPEAPEQA